MTALDRSRLGGKDRLVVARLRGLLAALSIVPLLFFAQGCIGTLYPELPLQGDLTKEQLAWVKRTVLKGREKPEPGLVAMDGIVIPLFPFIYEKGGSFWLVETSDSYWNEHQGPYTNGRMSLMLLCWFEFRVAWYDYDGMNRGYRRGFWGPFYPFSLLGWGDFSYKRKVPGPILATYFSPAYVVGNLATIPLGFVPAKWFYDGNEGSYWHVLMGLVGHIRTKESRAAVILWFPIKYWTKD